MRCDQMIELYSDFLLTTCGYATATGLSEVMDGEVSHDSVTRFLSSNNFTSKDLWKMVKSDVKSIACDGGVLVIDDTIEEKPHTDENDIICWHWDHAKSRQTKGVNILNMLINYDGSVLPISYEIIKKDEKFIDEKTGKPKRRSRVSKNEMFLKMFDVAIKNYVRFQYVAGDSWFSSKGNMQHIDKKKKKFIFALKSNRLVAVSKKDKLAGNFKNVSSLELDENSTKEVYIQGLSFPVLLCKQIFTNKDNSEGILYLVSNDTDLEYAQAIVIYQKRWSVEVYHRNLKQNSALAKSPTKTVKTQSNHIFMAIYSFCKMQMLSLKKQLNPCAIRNKMLLKANKTMMQELRELKLATP